MNLRSFLLGCGMVAVIAALTFTGCGSGEYSSVEGIVTLDGAPLADAKVMFHAPGRPMATARTDDAGRFQVETGGASGMKPGKYEVTIAAYVKPAKEGSPPSAKLSIPEKYLRPGQSGLKATIEEGANDKLNFELTTI